MERQLDEIAKRLQEILEQIQKLLEQNRNQPLTEKEPEKQALNFDSSYPLLVHCRPFDNGKPLVYY